MRKQDIKVGEDYAVGRSRYNPDNNYLPHYNRATVLEVIERSYKTKVTIQVEDSKYPTTVDGTEIRMPWAEWAEIRRVYYEKKRAEQDEVNRQLAVLERALDALGLPPRRSLNVNAQRRTVSFSFDQLYRAAGFPEGQGEKEGEEQ